MDTQDIVVPRTQLPQLLPRIKEVGERYQLPVISFGHAGDGNVHVNIIKDVAENPALLAEGFLALTGHGS